MLDTKFTSQSHITKTVHEHRAPTDDSIRLATELREKVLNEIVHELSPMSNVLRTTNIIKTSYSCDKPTEFIVGFNINGENYSARASVPKHSLVLDNPQEVLKKLADQISNEITCLLLPEIAENFTKLLGENK